MMVGTHLGHGSEYVVGTHLGHGGVYGYSPWSWW